MLTFIVPGNPVPKERPRTMKGGWTFTPKRTLEAERKIAAIAREAMKKQGIKPFKGPVSLAAYFYRGDKRRVDLDNLLKTVADALNNGVAYDDDSQIVYLMGAKHYDKSNPRTGITVQEV